MDLNQVKKDLYKQKPTAYRIGEGLSKEYGGFSFYRTECEESIVYFEVPFSDMGETHFGDMIESQLLIRWIKTEVVK